MPNYFVALPVRPNDWLGARVPSPPARVRAFHPEDLHATVAFLGSVDERRARRAFDAARAWDTGPIDATLGPVIALGNPRKPSAISALVIDGAPRLAAAESRHRDAIHDAAGTPRETRPPRPHVTLARIHRKASDAEHAAALRWASTLPVDEVAIRFETIALYGWDPSREERLFRIVEERSL